MIGTILNSLAILAGGTAGLTVARDISAANQQRLKVALGAFTVYVGLSLTWNGVNGSFRQVLGQLGVVLLSLMLGNATGRLLHLQSGLNRLGQAARRRFSDATTGGGRRPMEGFITCSLLFCVGPMAILGAIQDGLTGSIKILGIKSVMDGLATMAFSKTFGWGVLLAAVPVLIYQGGISLAAGMLQPFLDQKDLLDSVNATGGMLLFCVALLVLEIWPVRVADYLPSLVYAPLLTWWFR